MSQPDLSFITGVGNWNQNGPALFLSLPFAPAIWANQSGSVRSRLPVVRSLVAKVNTAQTLRCLSRFIMRHYTGTALPLLASGGGVKGRGRFQHQQSRWNRGLPIKCNALEVRTLEGSGNPSSDSSFPLTPLGTKRLLNHVFRHIAALIKMRCDGGESREDRLEVVFPTFANWTTWKAPRWESRSAVGKLAL